MVSNPDCSHRHLTPRFITTSAFLFTLFLCLLLPVGKASAQLMPDNWIGTAPALANSSASLQLAAPVATSQQFHWQSSDTAFGNIDTGFIPATQWKLTAQPGLPVRLVFTATSNGLTFNADLVFDNGIGVVDVARGGQHVRFQFILGKIDPLVEAINHDDPTSALYIPLIAAPGANAIVYGGSEPGTSDILRVTAQVSENRLPVVQTTWSVTGPGAGAYTPPALALSPTWNVGAVLPTPGVLTFQCTVRFAGGFATTVRTNVLVGVRTDDVIVVGWINGAAVTLPPVGVSPWVLATLPPLGPPVPSAFYANFLVAQLSLNFTSPSTNTMTVTDRLYILNWLFKFAPSPNPAAVIPGGDFRDATNSYEDPSKVAAYYAVATNYKLFNEFQVKYTLSAPGKFGVLAVIKPAPSIPAVGIGTTNNPAGSLGGGTYNITIPISTIASIVFPLLPQGFIPPVNVTVPITVPTVLAQFPGQSGPENGLLTTFVGAPDHISQINDGAPDAGAIRAFNLLTGAAPALPGTPGPIFWEDIGSQIRFVAGAGTGPTVFVQPYPTYYEYHNGKLVATTPQAPSPLGNFVAAPYPYGTVPTTLYTDLTGGSVVVGLLGSILVPAPIGGLPALGIPVLYQITAFLLGQVDIPGGRYGICVPSSYGALGTTLLGPDIATTVRVPPPAYSVP